jgi:hypothetical protein
MTATDVKIKITHDAILNQGPGVLECDEKKKGILPRVVRWTF